MQFLLAVIAFSIVTLAFLWVHRIYRSPGKPAWLDRELVATTVCVGFTGAFALTFGAVVSAAIELPLPLWGDVATSLGAVALAAWAARLFFRWITLRQKVL